MKVVQLFGKGVSDGKLRLSLCDINSEMTGAWMEHFFGVEAVEIVQGDLLETAAEAVVSPANSFGDMSGGVDKHIDDFGFLETEVTPVRVVLRNGRDGLIAGGQSGNYARHCADGNRNLVSFLPL